jgi:P-type Ca2+ transporter type 2C
MEKPDHCLSPEEVLTRLGSSIEGLDEAEARSRLTRYGPNELEAKRGVPPLKIFLRQFKNFMTVVLVAAALISIGIAVYNGTSEEYLDAAVIIIIVLINAILGFVQEYRAEKALEALRELAAPTATVIRSGKEVKVPAKELVPGDVFILSTGDKVPADGRVIEAANLRVNEAPLTGESGAVTKGVACASLDAQPMERDNMAFAGCIVEYGRGKAVVTETGMGTQLGKIAELIEGEDRETPLQVKLARLGRQLGVLVILTCVVVFLVGLVQSVPASDMFLTSVSLAVAAIPEGLPAIVTVSLALGVQRMAKRNAIVRSLPAVETLGSATVICTDKTGTLTMGEMNAREIWMDGKIEVSGEGYEPVGRITKDGAPVALGAWQGFDWLVRAGALCNDSSLGQEKGRWTIKGDSTEGTLLVLARKHGLDLEALKVDFPRESEVPFDSDKKRMITVHAHSGMRYAFLKGAAESVLSICTTMDWEARIALDGLRRSRILEANDAMADRALRVLAIGMKEVEDGELEEGFVFLGLVGMIDAPRKEAIKAIERCKRAGIRVIMITGDHERTARAIAEEMGLAEKDAPSLTGRDLSTMSAADLAQRIKEVNVFARVSPEDKAKIVLALQKNGEVVAMTGDGVNDAPALKNAEIGVAMGITGTDVSKEAADIILTDDNFASIINAVEEGRGIYGNIRKFVSYLLCCNAGEVLAMFLASLIFVEEGMIPFLLPIQILWMNLVTDGFPALALGLEKTSPTVMDRGPRDPEEPPVDRRTFVRIAFLGLLMAVGSMAVFQIVNGWALATGAPTEEGLVRARTAAFCAIVSFQLLLAFSARSEEESLLAIGPFSNRKLILAVLVSFLAQLAVVYLPGIGDAFGTAPLSIEEWGLVLAVGLTGLVANEAWKAVARARSSPKAKGATA